MEILILQTARVKRLLRPASGLLPGYIRARLVGASCIPPSVRGLYLEHKMYVAKAEW